MAGLRTATHLKFIADLSWTNDATGVSSFAPSPGLRASRRDGSPSIPHSSLKISCQVRSSWRGETPRGCRTKSSSEVSFSNSSALSLQQGMSPLKPRRPDPLSSESFPPAQIVASEWWEAEADDVSTPPTCSCCDGLLTEIQQQLTSLRSDANSTVLSCKGPASLKPSAGSASSASKGLLASGPTHHFSPLAVEVNTLATEKAQELGRTPSPQIQSQARSRQTSAFTQRKAVLLQAEELLHKLLKNKCCSTVLPRHTWEDLLEQSIKARRFRQTVQWAKIGKRQGLLLGRKTYERLVAAACEGKKLPQAQLLWDIWTLRKSVESCVSPLPRALWCALIMALGRQGEPHRAELIFSEMRDVNGWHRELEPPCADEGRETMGFGHQADSKSSQLPDQSGTPGDNRLCGSDSPHGPEVGTVIKAGDHPAAMAFNSIMDALSREGHTRQVEQYFQEMVVQWGIQPNRFTFSALVRAHCTAGNIAEAENVLQRMRSFAVEPDGHVYSILMNWYAKRGDVQKVEILVRKMKSAGVPVDKAIQCSRMQAYSVQGKTYKVKQLFTQLETSGVEVDSHLLCTLMHSLGKQGRLGDAWHMLSQYRPDTSVSTVEVWTAVIGASLKNGDVKGAVAALEALQKVPGKPGVQTFNTILWGVMQGQGKKAATELLQRTEHLWGNSLTPNLATYSILIHLYTQLADVESVCLVLEDMLKAELRPDDVFLRALRQSLASSGLVQQSARLAQLLKKAELGQ